MFENYREYRDDTLELVQGAFRKRASEEALGKFEKVASFGLFRTAVFELLLNLYCLNRRISRFQVRRKMQDGTFWEDFLEFLQSVDWEKVIELILKIIEAILIIT